MYARIARSEGGDPDAIEKQIAEMDSQIEGAAAGELPAGARRRRGR